MSTNHIQICQDPELWYNQNVRDIDIDRLHRKMIGYAQFYMLGDVIRMRTTTVAAFSYASGRHERPSKLCTRHASTFSDGVHRRVASTSQGLHGSCRRILAELHGREDRKMKSDASQSSRTSRLGVRTRGDHQGYDDNSTVGTHSTFHSGGVDWLDLWTLHAAVVQLGSASCGTVAHWPAGDPGRRILPQLQAAQWARVV